MNKAPSLRAWRIFCAVARSGNISDAAAAEGIPVSAASRAISELERDLGFALLDRRTRPAGLTKDFEKLLPLAKRLLRAESALLQAAASIREEAKGEAGTRVVRVSIPVDANRTRVLVDLLRYARHHPKLKFEFTSELIGTHEVEQGGIDIALFGFRPDSPRIFSLPSFEAPACLFASRAYAKQHPLPKKIGDLQKCRLIMGNPERPSFSRKLSRGDDTWYIPRGQDAFHGDWEACRLMLLAGEGIAVDLNPAYMQPEIRSGEVFQVLPGWHRAPWQMTVSCRKGLETDPVIRAVMEVVRESASRGIGKG
ncbi:MAG: LysR family transcriptional regulator [Sutterellaceae bacterium]|nr:LysR family transcriptional regulator [Sutterellaceae bacterium]MDD7442513.1 LysR family transcriptional regulator [Sutterellaceae bacterium]MDY2869220.1 LysR family transcriptional regulator [Mesosutterella sp.]